MSDDGKTPPEGGEFKAITTQDELNRITGERVRRAEAKFADYDALKTKAGEFDKATEANKTALQVALDRADVAEKKVGGYEQRDQATKWAEDAVKGSTIPASILRGSTEDEIKAHFEQVKAGWAPPAATTKRTAVPPGKSGTDGGGSRAAAALRQLRGSAQ